MDVLSLRKASGEVSGDIRINGDPQESNSFRRVTGYVEQFDVQSPQLTVRETVEFSAKMRLDESIPLAEKLKFVDVILATLELDTIAGFLVGNDTGGLSFEQKKRLSIAVELASNPSIIFLDEPTSGLDARAASVVMRCLRRIADRGVAVVATIHQPSVAIFNSFDSLLLLKRGGESVFFGELGDESCNLIEYFESYPATSIIKGGENPATWMLTTIGAGSAGSDADSFDFAKAYAQSPLASDCIDKIKSMNYETKISMPKKYATSTSFQLREVFRRLWKIYLRSPGYNRVRLMVSAIVALLFGSVFASQRVPQNESDMNSRVTSIYITALFLGVNALATVLPVFEMERNMFYRHKASLMYNDNAVTLAFTIVEIPFILFAGLVSLWFRVLLTHLPGFFSPFSHGIVSLWVRSSVYFGTLPLASPLMVTRSSCIGCSHHYPLVFSPTLARASWLSFETPKPHKVSVRC
jgi:ABC-type multidrug transport system ATPase subunit